MPSTANDPRYRVGSVARALSVVDLVADAPDDGLSLSEISRALGTSKSTAYALVRTLVDLGYLRDVVPGPRYQLGMTLVRLGDVASRAQPYARACQPVLVELTRDTGLTSRVAVVEAGYPVFVARVDAPGAIRFHTPLGVRELPHTSSAGKAILAMLSEEEVTRIIDETGLPARTRKTITDARELRADLATIRRRGFAIDDEEDVEGVFCIAAPFFDHGARVAGAISATGIKVDLAARRIEEVGRVVRDAAARVTGLIGGRMPVTDVAG